MQTDMFSYWNDDVPVSHMTNFEKVRQFHEIYGQEVNAPWTYKLVDFRWKLILEESLEVLDAVFDLKRFSKDEGEGSIVSEDKEHRAALLKELADLLYVIYGAGVALGLDLDKAFDLVHQSNLSKLGADGKPIYREDGKVLKGPNYKQADVTALV